MADMSAAPGFTRADLERVAEGKSFQRGVGYIAMVDDLDITASQISATVYGTHDYAVSLTCGDQGLRGNCSCPHGREGFFCKHCVAVGLSVLEAGAELPRVVAAKRARADTLRCWLESLSKQELLAELYVLLDDDRDLRRRFELRAASEKRDVEMVRQAVRELVAPRGDYVSYEEADDYANHVCEAAGVIVELIEAGAAHDAIHLTREAISLLSHAYEYIDDSYGSVSDAAWVLLSAHLRACQAAPPEPASLADYLANLLLVNNHGVEPKLDDYADLLGRTGFERLHDRIGAAYAANPADRHAKRLMESLARAEGDIDALIAIHAADLDDRGWAHLRIAQELDQAGCGDEALSWAERGLREATHPDTRLVEYLAGRYASAGRADDVLALRHARFEANRTLANYQLLRQAATDAGTWPAERTNALNLLRADAARIRGQASPAWAGPVLVDVLLEEGDVGAAWAAARGAATQTQWLRLADAAAETRPAEALAVYLKAIEPLRAQTGNRIYERIASLLLSARACHQALGTVAEFERYLALFRADQKRKRNLMKLLSQHGL
jgi:uncharacterized Zn finger protein